MLRRPPLCLLLLTAISTITAGEDGPLRELVDRVRELEAQIALVERSSVTAPDRAALWTGATRGLVAAADPYGAYLTAEEVAVRDLGSEAMRFGLGFDWRRSGDSVLVTRVVPRSQAARAGIHIGCSVLAVDGVEAAGGGSRFAEALPEDDDYETVSGFLHKYTGRIPELQEEIRFGAIQFTIAKKNERRIQQIKVKMLPPDDIQTSEE